MLLEIYVAAKKPCVWEDFWKHIFLLFSPRQ